MATFWAVLAIGVLGQERDLEALFTQMESGSALESLEASQKLAGLYTDLSLPRLEQALQRSPARTLGLVGELKTEGSAKLLERRLKELLESKEEGVPRMAMVAAGLRKLRSATSEILERSPDPAALRALGRIWEQKAGEEPLGRKDEIDRLTVLALVHRLSMGPGASVESCEAMLRTMTPAELDGFLGKHAGDLFPSRGILDRAVRRKDFDPAKGARVHEALLASPDAELVAQILKSSPFRLSEPAVRARLKDDRPAGDGKTVGDYAARRLKE
jgi:hypothetical protein